MAFIDDVNAVRTRSTQARTDMNTLVQQLATVLYNVIRPQPTIAWISDDILHQACTSFAVTAVQQTVAPQPALTDPGKILT